MNELHNVREWWVRRFRCAVIAGVASASLLAGDANDARAEWFALPKLYKPADHAEQKSNKGFTGAIRKLLKEAKTQEDQGNLDRAITLADRANKVAESTSSVVKPAADVSPEATAKYASELRLKKAELSVKRPGGATKRESVPDATRKPAEPQQVADKRPKPKPDSTVTSEAVERALKRQEAARRATTEPVNNTRQRQDVAKRAAPVVAAEVVERAPKRMEAAKHPVTAPSATTDVVIAAAEIPVNAPKSFPASGISAGGLSSRKYESPALPPMQPGKFSPPAILPEDLAAEEAANAAGTPDLPLKPQEVAVTDMNGEEAFFEVEEVRAGMEQAAAISDAQESNVVPTGGTLEPMANPFDQGFGAKDLPRLKLRPRYDETGAVPDDLPAVAGAELAVAGDDEPAVWPIATATEDQTDSSLFPDDANESRSAVAAADEPGSEVDSDSGTTLLSDADLDSKTGVDRSELTWFDKSEPEFPTEKVIEMRQRLESAVSLNPGEISPWMSDVQTASANESGTSVGKPKPGGVRLRERRQMFRDLPSAVPVHMTSGIAIPAIVGRTSMLQWRPAREPLTDGAIHGPRSAAVPSMPLPEDLRESLRGITRASEMNRSHFVDGSLFTIPSVEFGGAQRVLERPQVVHSGGPASAGTSPAQEPIKGTLWDHASAPIDGHPGLPPLESASNIAAPAPPQSAAVEQTVFHPATNPLHRYHQSTADWSGAARDASSVNDPLVNAADQPGGLRPGRTSSASETIDEQTASTRAILTHGPVERFAVLFGIPASTASTIIAAGGLALLIAGLWMVRSVVRTDKS
jgi:hypothetical protein